MIPILVDSNILLDVFTEDDRWFSWSANMLASVGNASRLIIDPIIYAEISVRFSEMEELSDLLDTVGIERETVSYAAAFLAGKVYRTYRGRGGVRRSPLPDFFIGAHAAIAGYRLLTRDASRYRGYFPTLEIIAPASG